MIPLVPQTANWSRPAHVQIYQYDSSPLGTRKPILFVHGLDDEIMPVFHFQPICNYLRRNKEFRSRYKIYLVRWNTHLPEQQECDELKVAIRNLCGAQRGSLCLVGLSMGGNLVRNAMADPAVYDDVSHAITLGAIFHGSPLFCSDWMQYSMLRNITNPFTQLDRTVAYRIYFSLHKNLLQDYQWDNCDQQMPDIGSYRFRFPLSVKGKLVPNSKPAAAINTTAGNDKLIVYAGYMKNPLPANDHTKFHWPVIRAVSTLLGSTIPAHFANEHAVLRLLNFEIAEACSKEHFPDRAYGMNDGIVPVVSALSIPAKNGAPVNDDMTIEQLKSAINVKKARLFANVYHVTFIDGNPPWGYSKKLTDEFSPNEKPRSFFDWLLEDIFDDSPQAVAPATGVKANILPD